MSDFALIFYKGHDGFFGKLVRWWTSSPYSHVALLFHSADGALILIEAMPGVGIRERRMATIDPAEWTTIQIPVSPSSYDHLLAWARQDLGEPYDWSGLFWSQVLHIPRSHPDKWFCSEFAVAALQLLNMLVGKKACSFSPGSLYCNLT